MDIEHNYSDIKKVKGKTKETSFITKKGLIALIGGVVALTALGTVFDHYLLRPVELDYFKAQDAIIRPYAEKARDFQIQKDMDMARAEYGSN